MTEHERAPSLIDEDDGETESREQSSVPSESEFFDGASRAVLAAIRRQHEQGIATTHLLEGRLVRVHPDGHREDLEPDER